MPAKYERDRPEFIEAEEGFIADVQFYIQALLNEKNVSYANLADLLGISTARVSQMFGDSAKNLTLRTVARIFAALGEECRLTNATVEARLARQRASYDKDARERECEVATFDIEIDESVWHGGGLPGNDNDREYWKIAA
jgi:DNA-binding Xre family transcriptional regulator